MLIHKTYLRVRYADTDQMGFVYNGKYFEYFEVGRTEMMRSVGLPYRSIEEQGFQMPVRETGIRFKNAALYDEELEVETRVPSLPESKVHLEYTIRGIERGIVIAEGFVDLMFMNGATKRACRPPEFFIKAIEKYYE